MQSLKHGERYHKSKYVFKIVIGYLTEVISGVLYQYRIGLERPKTPILSRYEFRLVHWIVAVFRAYVL